MSFAACGDSKTPTTQTTATVTDGNNASTNTTTTEGNTTVSNAVLSSSSSSSKMVQQAHADAEEQSDLSETATTGTDDAGGSQKSPRNPSASFSFHTSAAVNLGAVASAFEADVQFHGLKGSNATLNGNVKANVAPTPMPANNSVDDGNLTVVLTLDVNRTLANGDVITVVTEPNLTLTKSGRRTGTTVIRTLNGMVRRTLNSSVDANANFDLEITHAGTKVVDTYASGALSTRVTSGTTTVANKLTGETAAVTFNDLTRGKPSTCLCPTGGSVQMVVTDPNGQVSNHTYDFSGTCGSATVDVTAAATADVSKTADANTVDGTATATANTAAASNGNATVSSTAHVHGELSWQDCLPQADAT